MNKLTAFKRNKNLKELIKSSTTKWKDIMKKDECYPCSVNNRTLSCKLLIFLSTLKGQQTDKSYSTFNEVNCFSAYVIYLMWWTLSKKQYVGKSETSFNIRLNNHRKEVEKPDAILQACNFIKNETFTQVFFWEFCKNFKNTFFNRTPQGDCF